MTRAQDGLGVPVTPFQDPLHYPHGTKWMAPGAHTRHTSIRPPVMAPLHGHRLGNLPRPR